MSFFVDGDGDQLIVTFRHHRPQVAHEFLPHLRGGEDAEVSLCFSNITRVQDYALVPKVVEL
jgi:hypothetical protein